jgi:hypothetical protein
VVEIQTARTSLVAAHEETALVQLLAVLHALGPVEQGAAS